MSGNNVVGDKIAINAFAREVKSDKVSVDETREWVRTFVTGSIVFLYFICVFGVVMQAIRISPQAKVADLKQIVDIIQALVMPIITLVLGFYFGSETKK